MSAEDITSEELLARLDGDGARVSIADPEPAVRAAWRRTIDKVRREHLAPAGMRLRHTGRDRGDLVIWLELAADGSPPARPEPLPVPDEVIEVHALLGSQNELGERLDVEPASLPRARRLLQVLLDAAEARGYSVVWASAFSALDFERDGHREPVACFEEREQREVAPTVSELGDKAPRYEWQRVQTESRMVATGRLCLQLSEHGRGRRRRWADRQRWRLEDKLGEVLAELERRTDDAVARRQVQAEQALQREAQWREAMERARRGFTEQRRRDELLRQVEAWHAAERVRAYAQVLATHAGAGDDPDAEAWATWASSYAESLDPIVAGGVAPEEIEPTADQLRPHLRGWSPYGPEQR